MFHIGNLLSGNREKLFVSAGIVVILLGSCFAQPALTLSARSGPPTTKLLVSGNGFDPYSAVDIYFDTKDEALAVTDGNGAFGKIGMTVPGSAKPGGHWVTGVERYTGLAGQSHFLVETNWTEFHFSPDHQGLNPYENVLNPQNVTRLRLRWRSQVSKKNNYGTILSACTLVNGIVYIGSFDTHVYAINASTGATIWNYRAGDKVNSTPAIDSGILYVGSLDGIVHALNARTGHQLWSYQTNGELTDPVIVDGVVYIASNEGDVYALDAYTGALIWDTHTSVYGDYSPAVANGILYAGSDGSGLYALDASTGHALWSYPTGDMGFSSPAVANGVVYAGADDGLYAINAKTGALLWKYPSFYPTRSSPAVANGVVYIGSQDDSVYALNAASGTVLWSYATGSTVTDPPTVANGVVYIGSWDNNVYALDARSGALLWTYTASGLIDYSSAAVANGVVCIGSGDGSLYAFDLSGSDTETPPPAPDPHSLVPDSQLKASRPK